jgi:hypothetical protein
VLFGWVEGMLTAAPPALTVSREKRRGPPWPEEGEKAEEKEGGWGGGRTFI